MSELLGGRLMVAFADHGAILEDLDSEGKAVLNTKFRFFISIPIGQFQFYTSKVRKTSNASTGLIYFFHR